MKKMKTLLLALVLLAGRAASPGQVIEFTGPALVEYFDSMGSGGTITPAGWYVGWPQGGTDGGALRTTNVVVNNGGTVAPGGNAGFNCGNTMDRALGVAATSTGNPPGPNRFVEVQIHNNTG